MYYVRPRKGVLFRGLFGLSIVSDFIMKPYEAAIILTRNLGERTNGVFGDMFDLDGDGSLDSTELGLDYAETGNKTILQDKKVEQAASERYRYCKVTFEQGNSCFYIADDSTIKDGDWVRVQYGRKQEFLIGQVADVYECTKKSAPEPPELTKHIINKTAERYWAAAKNYKLTGNVLLSAVLILAGIALGLKFAFG